MATLIPNTFSSYELTDDEQTQGSLLTITQKQVIQNHICNIAEEKLALVFDASKPTAYAQEEASLAGQIAALKWMIDISEAAEAAQAYSANPVPQD